MADVSIRRVSDLIKEINNGTLTMRPPFQRRLVWTNVVKDKFLETVILGLPFPEVFIATGDIDTQTMDRKYLLVDGQQRLSTLQQYVQGSEDLVLSKVKPYRELTEEGKSAFLDYKVAVRDLGTVTESEVKNIFERINSTDYALNAIEKLNAKFNGEYKRFCDDLSQNTFFDHHRVFSMADMRRMRDLDFCVILTTTLMSTYYDRDKLNLKYLERYNDHFPEEAQINSGLAQVFAFIESCDFPRKSRMWKKTDLFTLLVELYALLVTQKSPLVSERVKQALGDFYAQVDALFASGPMTEEGGSGISAQNVFRYLKAATKATNDKYARIDRAEVVAKILESTIAAPAKRRERPSKKTKS